MATHGSLDSIRVQLLHEGPPSRSCKARPRALSRVGSAGPQLLTSKCAGSRLFSARSARAGALPDKAACRQANRKRLAAAFPCRLLYSELVSGMAVKRGMETPKKADLGD